MTKVIKAYRALPLSERQDKRVDDLIRCYCKQPPSYIANVRKSDEKFGADIALLLLVSRRGPVLATRFPAADLRSAQMPRFVSPLPAIDAPSQDTRGRRQGQLPCQRRARIGAPFS